VTPPWSVLSVSKSPTRPASLCWTAPASPPMRTWTSSTTMTRLTTAPAPTALNWPTASAAFRAPATTPTRPWWRPRTIPPSWSASAIPRTARPS